MTESTSAVGKKPLGVYATLERNERTHWFKVGAAFTNRDGSLTVLLDAVPIGTNRLQIREQRAWDDGRPAAGASGAPTSPRAVAPLASGEGSARREGEART